MKKLLNFTDDLYQYLLKNSVHETKIQQDLRAETANLDTAIMQSSPEQGQLMQLLIKLINAKMVLEIGTYTGYGALTFAYALPADGKVITCDHSEEFTTIAKKYWQQAGFSEKIELKFGNALTTITNMLNVGYQNKFDLIFIDADKLQYDKYYELSLELVRTNGIIAIDNVLWNGKVANDTHNDKQTNAIRTLNQKIYNDSRVHACIVPITDGLTVAIKL